jgi:hypothetical protein
MASSLTERLIGNAGVSSTGTAGSFVASPRRVSKTDWISAPTSAPAMALLATCRDDLGGQGEKLAAVDTLFGHLCSLETASPRCEH